VGPALGLIIPGFAIAHDWTPLLGVEATVGRTFLHDAVSLRGTLFALANGPSNHAPVRCDRTGCHPVWRTRTLGRGLMGFEVSPAPNRRTVIAAAFGLGLDIGLATAQPTDTVPSDNGRLAQTTVTGATGTSLVLTLGARRDRPIRIAASMYGTRGGVNGSFDFFPVFDIGRRYLPERAIASRRPLVLMSVAFGERW